MTAFRRSARAPKNAAVLLDLGASKMAALIVGRDEVGQPAALGFAQQSSEGVTQGRLVDFQKYVDCLGRVVEEAEKKAQVRVKSAFLGVPGSLLQTKQVQVQVKLLGRFVSTEDLRRLEAAAALQVDSEDNLVIHAIAQFYQLDDQGRLENPVGMMGAAIAASVLLVYVPKARFQNVMLAAQRVHLRVDGLFALPYVVGLMSLSEDEQKMGGILVDVGAASINLAGFKNGALRFLTSVPMGAERLTKDLAYGLGVSWSQAERLKILQGNCVRDHSQAHKTQTYRVASDDTISSVGREYLVDILSPRVHEMLDQVKHVLQAAWGGSFHTSRFVLSGGGTQLGGFRSFFVEHMGRGARMAELSQAVKDPAGHTHGLDGLNSAYLFWKKNQKDPGISLKKAKRPTVFSQILTWFRENL